MTNQETNVTNYYESTLASSLSSGSTSATVTSASGSPSVPFYMVVDAGDSSTFWVSLVTAKSGTTFTLDSAAPRTFGSGTEVGCYPVAELWTDINDRVEAHDHSGSTQGTAVSTWDLVGHDKATHDALFIDHSNLSSLANDDHTQYHNNTRHDAHDHSTALGTASLADLGTANGSDLDDLGTFLSNVEVDDATEVASYTLTTSYASAATVSLTIPASWGSWKCFAHTTYVVVATSSTDTYSVQIEIDGEPQQAQEDIDLTTPPTGGNAISGYRSGMTTTGSRDVSLQMKESSGADATASDIFLYARAVRTS